MTNVKFPRKEIEKQIKLTKENIEKISLFGTPLEKIDDNEIEIEIFPNRPDLISLQGFLRGFKAFLNKEPGLKKYKLNKPKENYFVKIEPSVSSVRPYAVCAIIKNLNFDDEKIKEIVDLQERLHKTIGRNRKKVAIGIYPLEKINLPITYHALHPKDIKFIPLEGKREMSSIQILQKHSTGREYAHLLKDCDKFPIFSDSKNNILSMPPIINSHDVGKITHQTKEVFIECSGSHLETLNKTLNIIVTTLADMSGKIYQMFIINEEKKTLTPDLTPGKIKISLENINKLIGLELKEKDLPVLLSKMGYEYSSPNVLVPAWRTDILHEVDIAEDIAIAYGYDKLMPEISSVSTLGEESKDNKISSIISELLIGLQLTETSSYHLIKQRESDLMRLQEKIEVLDSKTEYKILRPNLLIPTLRNFSENKDHDYPQKIFEIGTIFSKNNKEETGIEENESLIVAISPGNFTEIKQILDYLMSSLKIKHQVKESNHQSLIEGRTAQISINNKIIGHIGEVKPETLKAWTIKMPLSILEISLTEIFSIMN